MVELKKRISYLLDKYVSGNYSPEELDELLILLESPEKEYDKYVEPLWEAILELESEENTEEVNRYRKEAGQIIQRQKRQIVPKAITKSRLMRIAATVALLISIAAVLYWYRQEPALPAQIALVSTTVPNGQKDQVCLEDGSSVFLNSGSQLYYPESFRDKKREVKLSGEAFFDISPDRNRVFVIKTTDMIVEVLGTSFNVKAYEPDDYMSVTVVAGEVLVTMDDNNINLLPNERLYVNKSTGEFKKDIVQADKYARWTKGYLSFNRTPLKEVVSTLERWYDVKIKMNSTYPIFITGEHDNKSLTAVLESVCFTSGLNYSEKDDHYVLFYP